MTREQHFLKMFSCIKTTEGISVKLEWGMGLSQEQTLFPFGVDRSG